MITIKPLWPSGLRRWLSCRGLAWRVWVRIPLETYIFILTFSLPPHSEQVNGAVAIEIKHVHSPAVIVVFRPQIQLIIQGFVYSYLQYRFKEVYSGPLFKNDIKWSLYVYFYIIETLARRTKSIKRTTIQYRRHIAVWDSRVSRFVCIIDIVNAMVRDWTTNGILQPHPNIYGGIRFLLTSVGNTASWSLVIHLLKQTFGVITAPTPKCDTCKSNTTIANFPMLRKSCISHFVKRYCSEISCFVASFPE